MYATFYNIEDIKELIRDDSKLFKVFWGGFYQKMVIWSKKVFLELYLYFQKNIFLAFQLCYLEYMIFYY